MEAYQKRTKRLLIGATVLFGLLILPAFALAPFVGFLDDDPGAGGSALTVLMVSWVTFWLICAVSILASWIFYKVGRYRAARWTAVLPILAIVFGAIEGFILFA